MLFKRLKVTFILLLHLTIICLGLEILEINTDYADYKILHENQELELSCKNNVDSLQAVTWITPSYVPYDKYTLDIDIKDGKNVYTLTIKNATREYAGKYICKSHTRDGDELTKDVHVGVAPKIKLFVINGKEITDNKKITISGNATLKCKEGDVSYPKPVRALKKNGKILGHKNGEDFTLTESGNYTCELINSIGHSSRTVSIIIDTSTKSAICTTGLVFAIIGVKILAIYFFIYIYIDRITDKEFIKNIRLIVLLVFVLILIILIIVNHSLECEMTWLCIIEIICGILFAIFVAVVAFRKRKNDQPPIEKTGMRKFSIMEMTTVI